MDNNLKDLRERIDAVDNDIIRLFQERMKIASSIGEYKKANKLPALDVMREREKLSDLIQKSEDDFKSYTSVLYSLLFELSRSYQDRILYPTSDLKDKISYAIDNTSKLFPPCATVACQGVEGAYSQHACEKLFQIPRIMYFNNFASIFASIDKGLCDYGVLPIENSTSGSVKQIYDLMMYYNFNIVRSVRVKVDHNLLAKKGTDIRKVREIFSHEHALAQCTNYINSLGNVKVTVVENTAVAAKMVAESDRDVLIVGIVVAAAPAAVGSARPFTGTSVYLAEIFHAVTVVDYAFVVCDVVKQSRPRVERGFAYSQCVQQFLCVLVI